MDKVSVTFVTADGESETVQAPIGISLMQAARFHSQNEYVMGIEADCMGCQSCGTCHVVVNDEWIDKVGKVRDGSLEEDLIYYENGKHQHENSRLSCQVILKKKHDGLIVRVP